MPSYQKDSSNPKKQIPNTSPGGTNRFSFAECPLNEVVTKRPTYVNINKVGTYCFLYETTASFGGTTLTEGYITGSVVQNAAAGGIKLDISPVAWQRIDATDVRGDVTFVYVRVR
jgi:hypothetical protein